VCLRLCDHRVHPLLARSVGAHLRAELVQKVQDPAELARSEAGRFSQPPTLAAGHAGITVADGLDDGAHVLPPRHRAGEEPAQGQVLRTVEEDPGGGFSIPSGASHLLVVGVR